jgi:hypothetical protein
MNRLKALLLIFSLIMLISCSKKTTETDPNDPTIPSTGKKIYGKIVYSYQNSEYYFNIGPLSGANVKLIQGNKTATTGNDGQYSFSGLSEGYYTIEVTKNSYATKRIEVYLSNASDKRQDVHLVSNSVVLPRWLSFPLGSEGGAVSYGGEGIYVTSHGANSVYAYVNVLLQNNRQYQFSCDILKDVCTSRAGFFINRAYLENDTGYGEYWNIDDWHTSTYNLQIFDDTVIDTSYVWQDSVITDTVLIYRDSVAVSLMLKAEGGTVQGAFNKVKIKKL